MLEIKNLTVKAGNFVLNNISFDIEKGDYFVLLGVSGSGKTMLIETIAGIRKPVAGSILLNKKDITEEKIKNRKFGLVYQNNTLFPHLNVYDNIAYSLKGKNLNAKQIKAKVMLMAEETEVTGLLKNHVSELSGGEIQRVSLARTLAAEPDFMLLDEPLSALDIEIRKELINLLKKINGKGRTIIHITHDYEEAIALANKIAVIEKGTIVQQGTPEEVFRYPKSNFVAMLGGVRNFYKGSLIVNKSIDEQSELRVFKIKEVEFVLKSNEKDNTEGYITIDPEQITISDKKPESSAINNFKGIIIAINNERYGCEVCIDIGIDIYVLITKMSVERLKLSENKEVWISFKASVPRFIKL